jgi:hypothetical protein
VAPQGRSNDREIQNAEAYGCSLQVPSARTIAAQVLGYLALFLTISGKMRFVAAFMPATAWLSVGLCVLGTVEVFAWKKASRFQEPGHAWLERSVLGRALTLPTLATAAFVWPEGKTSVLVITGAILLMASSRLGLFALRLLEEHRAEQRARRRGRRRAQLRADGLLGEAALPRAAPKIAAAGFLEVASRRIIGAALILLTCLAIATDVEAAHTGEWRVPRHPSSGGATTHKTKTKQQPRQQRPAGRGEQHTPGKVGGPGGANTESSLNLSCETVGPVPNVAPSTIRKLEKLFTLAGGGEAIGCPHTVKVSGTNAGPIYWSLSWLAGNPDATAIAVIAPEQKPFVALAPTVGVIEQLVLTGRPIGAERQFARYYAGKGYVYVILSEIGSTLLTKQELGSGPLVVSPPAVATAIRSSDKQYGRWLWPSAPHGNGRNDIEYDLRLDSEGPILERIHYDPAHGTAWRGPKRRPIRYLAHQKNLPIWELQTWLPEPPQKELRLEREIEANEG